MPLIPFFKNWKEVLEKFGKVKPIRDQEAPPYEELSKMTPGVDGRGVVHRPHPKKREKKAAKKEELKKEVVEIPRSDLP